MGAVRLRLQALESQINGEEPSGFISMMLAIDNFIIGAMYIITIVSIIFAVVWVLYLFWTDKRKRG